MKSPEKLVDIYYNSVGLNGVLLLNIPPDKRGLIHENDVNALCGMKKILDETFSTNFARNASAKASSTKKGLQAKNILDDNLETYWSAEENVSQASIELTLEKEQKFNTAMLQENVLIGQRIEKFHLEYRDEIGWNKLAEGTTVGYKRLLRFSTVVTKKIRIVIDESRLNPTLASFGLFFEPETKE